MSINLKNVTENDLLEIGAHLIGVAGCKTKFWNQSNHFISTAQIFVFRFAKKKWLSVVCNVQIVSLKIARKESPFLAFVVVNARK